MNSKLTKENSSLLLLTPSFISPFQGENKQYDS